MDKATFEKLRATHFEPQPKEVVITDIAHIPDGTLVYGFQDLEATTNGRDRATVHIYKKNGMINRILHCGEELLQCNAFESMPIDTLDGVKAYGAPTSAEFLQVLGEKFGLNLRIKMFSPFHFFNEEGFKKAIDYRIENRLTDYANATLVDGEILLPAGGFYGYTDETFYEK